MDVIVGGGGIGGLAAAAALAARGVSVTVHERRSELIDAEGGAIVLGENLLLALDSLGATGEATRFADAKSFFSYADTHSRSHTPPHSNLSGGRYFYVSRYELHHALLHAAQRAGVTVVAASGIRSARSDGTVLFDTGEEARADLVIGADGVGSAIRHSMATTVNITPQHHYGILTALDYLLPEIEKGHMRERWNGTLRIGYGWLGNGASGVYLSCNEDGLTADQSHLDIERWVSAFPEQDAIIRAVAASNPKISALSQVVCSSWSDGRVVLLGDAAHAMPPHRGQGAAMAVLGAVHLGQVLGREPEFPKGDSGVRALLRQWEAEVRPVIRRTQRNAVLYCRAQSRWPSILLPLRPWVFRVTAKRIRHLDLSLLKDLGPGPTI
jgi:2-polyprenyl-6-methoxyphenol hydroxylase-like FAD-dependent oxidoreductase